MNFLPIISTADVAAVKALTRADREALKEKIDATDPHNIFTPAGDTRNPDKRKIICPKCGNGTGSDATPIEATFDGGAWLYNCFKDCNFSGDLLKIIATEENLNLNQVDDFCRALAIGARLTGIVVGSLTDQKYSSPRPATTPARLSIDIKDTPEFKQLVQSDIAEAINHVDDWAKDQRRGLSDKTIRHFKFGYLPRWIHPNTRIEGKATTPSRRIVIPTENHHYNAILMPEDRTQQNKNFWKMHAGYMELFNSAALATNDDLVVVVEGEFDCASLWQAFEGNISVVAVLGCGNWKKTLLPKLDGLTNKRFLILFDAEPETRKSAEKLRGELIRRGLPAVCRFFYDALTHRLANGQKVPFAFTIKVDANEILQRTDTYFLRNLTQDIIDDAQSDLDDARDDLTATENKKLIIETFPDVLKEKICEWESFNGKINPDVLSQIRDAANYLDYFNKFNMTAAVAQSTKTINSVAICKFYDPFTKHADDFFSTLTSAIKLAKTVVKQMKEEGGEFVADPPAELTALINLSLRDFKANVETVKKKYKKTHDAYLKTLNIKRVNEQLERQEAERNERQVKRKSRIDELHEMPSSPDRDAELVQLIRASCEWRLDRYYQPVAIKATAANADLIFSYDPVLDGLCGYDEFQLAYVFLKAPSWSKDVKKGDEWKDSDDSSLRNYLRRTYTEFSNKNLVFDWLTEFARTRSFHEVKEFFCNLPEWDGKPRAERIFVKFLKAEDSPYTREVTLNWLTAAVSRIFNPGCEYQLAPILLGEQGIGKSYLIKRLGFKWYGTLIDDVSDPHAVDAIQRMWLVEVKEMASMKKDVDSNKRFIDSAEDTRRAAYERRANKVPRHCVFIVTTNNRMCLTDMTGNRRYPIILCHGKPREYVDGLTDKYIAQVWAEVYQHYNELFKDGFDAAKLELSKDTQILSDDVAEQFTRDELSEDIKTFLDTKTPPSIIWHLLSKEERRRFFVEGNKIAIESGDLETRFKNFAGKRYEKIKDEYELACKIKEGIVRELVLFSKDGGSLRHLVFYGTVLREHICPAEIFHEAFDKTDRRKSIPKILEVLNKLDGWSQGKELRRADPAYSRQRIVYYRDTKNQTD